jgi:SAM-dependent methyltransferase
MAHAQHLQFVQIAAQHLADDFTQKRILEIGSYNVNGSIRPFFQGSTYVGVDIIPGPDVDVVCPGEKFADPDETFDMTVSCECFEHNPQWRETFLNMYRMTKPGGVIIFTCATTGRLEHGTTRTLPDSSPGNVSVGWDYYNNLKERDFTSRMRFDDLFKDYFFTKNAAAQDLYFIGLKNGRDSIFRFGGKEFAAEYHREAAALQAQLDAQSPYPAMLRLMSKIVLSPLRVAECLPDRQYQNFALAYIKTFNVMRRPVQRLYEQFRVKRQS